MESNNLAVDRDRDRDAIMERQGRYVTQWIWRFFIQLRRVFTQNAYYFFIVNYTESVSIKGYPHVLICFFAISK